VISRSQPLLMPLAAALVIFGLLGVLPDHSQRFLQILGGFLAVGSFEGDRASMMMPPVGSTVTPMMRLLMAHTPPITSLMAPFFWSFRCTV